MSNDFKSVLEVRTEVSGICVGGIGAWGQGSRRETGETGGRQGKGDRVMADRKGL